MNEQGHLFDEKTESRFREYHATNPEVYQWFKKFAFQKIRAGAKHVGAKAIFERIRFDSPVMASGDPFKVNNIFTPYYARLFMRDFPQYAGIFETRRAKADVEGVA
jgi:hypothetical protein